MKKKLIYLIPITIVLVIATYYVTTMIGIEGTAMFRRSQFKLIFGFLAMILFGIPLVTLYLMRMQIRKKFDEAVRSGEYANIIEVLKEDIKNSKTSYSRGDSNNMLTFIYLKQNNLEEFRKCVKYSLNLKSNTSQIEINTVFYELLLCIKDKKEEQYLDVFDKFKYTYIDLPENCKSKNYKLKNDFEVLRKVFIEKIEMEVNFKNDFPILEDIINDNNLKVTNT